MKILKQYEHLVRGYFPSKREVFDVFTKKHTKILYGETYDLLGVTIDSLKYYLFLGLFPGSTILIADSASTINASSGDAQTILTESKTRLNKVNRIIEKFHLPVRVQLMSELFKKQRVKELIEDVRQVVAESPEIQALLQKTVLQNRVRQEDKSAYKYGAEAIATAMLFDIKVGPPRERFYDEAAILVAKKLKRQCYKSMYLTPTYPLGLDFVYFLLHPEVEAYGLTPYKAGSNKLQDHRIILGKTTPEQLHELITTSFVPKHEGLPNPVKDLEHIFHLAQHFQKEVTYEGLL